MKWCINTGSVARVLEWMCVLWVPMASKLKSSVQSLKVLIIKINQDFNNEVELYYKKYKVYFSLTGWLWWRSGISEQNLRCHIFHWWYRQYMYSTSCICGHLQSTIHAMDQRYSWDITERVWSILWLTGNRSTCIINNEISALQETISDFLVILYCYVFTEIENSVCRNDLGMKVKTIA